MDSFVNGLIVENLGPLILGVILNTYLYGVVTFQYASYWTTTFNDPLWIKGTVAGLFVLDTTHTCSLIWMAWVYAVENFANPMGLAESVWPYPLSIGMTCVTALVTQLFIAYRTFRLTQHLPLFAASAVIALVTFGLGLTSCVKAFQTTQYMLLVKLKPFFAAWLCMEMVTDVIISASLVYTLWRSRTGFAKSDTVIRRLVRAAVQTGSFAGTFALLTAILFLGKPRTQFFCIPGLAISRVYTYTLMDTVLCRGELRDMMDSSRGGETLKSSRNPVGSARSLGELHIHKEVRTDVHYEPASVYALRKLGPRPHASRTSAATIPAFAEVASGPDRDAKWKEAAGWQDRSTPTQE